MLKQALYVENEELKKRIKQLEKKKDLETYMYILIIPMLGLLTSLIAWSTFWGWPWYGYVAFYSAIPYFIVAVALFCELVEIPE